MALTATIEIHPEYLHMTVAGDWSLADALALVPRIKEETDRAQRRKILVDALGIGGEAPTWTEKSTLGKRIAGLLHGYRLAVVAPRERLDYSAETVANNRGAMMTTKPTEEEALQWLLR
ncbi:MAG: hypothetical protein H0U76_19880 [Ktedonobacteraceae bacterium]|nr:hypothetical protein [Ktedonobacteraceae bacterium]